LELGLRGRVAVVGGGSAGLGLATARELVAAGARVVIAARSEERLRAAVASLQEAAGPGGEACGVSADLGTAEGCAAPLREAQERYGSLDCLLLNAGGPPPGHALDAPDEQWQRAFETVLLSVVRQVRLAVPVMTARGGGRIVAVTSTSVRQPIPDLVLSNTLRAGVVGFLKSLSTEVAAAGVLVNCLAPGRIATERVASLDAARARRAGGDLAAVRRAHLSDIPAGRYGEPAEFGRVAAFLLSFANTYITGTHIHVDGGLVRTPL
jgi:3-oxoacyl-[acyl-carrier protein] reductase